MKRYALSTLSSSILAFAGVGVLVIIAALLLPSRYAGVAGLLYCVNAVVGFTAGSILGKRERLALARMEASAAVQAGH